MPEIHATHPVAHRGDAQRVAELLELPGALLHGHFQLLAGMHTDKFFRFSTIARDAAALDAITGWLAPDVRPLAIDGVLAPTTAGVGLGWTLATSLGVPLHLATIDDADGRPAGVLGEPMLDGRRLLLVNDVVTTGHGLHRMSELAAERAAAPAGACWFLTRGDVDLDAVLGIPHFPIASWHLPAWEASNCQACTAGGEPELAFDLN